MKKHLIFLSLFIVFFHSGVVKKVILRAESPKDLHPLNWQVTLSPNEGSVEFVAIGRPSALKIRGKGGVPQGHFSIQKNNVTGQVSVVLNDFDTGMGLRNEHMKKKYLETESFPKAELKLEKMILPDSFGTSNALSLEEVSYSGTFSLHGKTQPLSGKAHIAKNQRKESDSVAVQTSFTLKLSDFGIMTPSFKGITVAEDVQVFVSFSAPLKQL